MRIPYKIEMIFEGDNMDDFGPEEFLIYETYFEDDNDINRNEGCCSTLIVLAVLFILVNVLIV